MARADRIGILTGGGDVPGLNSVIKSVTYRATELGFDVYGIRRGWEGLTHQRPGSEPDSTYVVHLDRNSTRAIDRTGGTWLHTSRTNPRKVRRSRLPAHLAGQADSMTSDGEIFDLTPVVLDNIESMGLDYLVPIGGDDTLSFAQTLHENGVPLIAIPKTMDNDVQGTEYCIGFSTAITRAKELINRQRTTLGSHERIGFFRIFGRDAGLHRALHRLRDVGTLPHPRGALRPRPPGGHPRRGPCQQPEPLRVRHRGRGRDLEGRQHPRGGRGRRVRASPQGQHRGDPRGRGARPDRHRDRVLRAHVRPALGRARLGRPDGRDHVRERRDGPRGRRPARPDRSRSATASTHIRPCRTRRCRRSPSTSPRCTTRSAIGRSTPGRSAGRSCSVMRWRRSRHDLDVPPPGRCASGACSWRSCSSS